MEFEKFLNNKLNDFDAGFDPNAWDSVEKKISADASATESVSNFDAGYDAQAWNSIAGKVAQNNRIFQIKQFSKQLKYAGVFAGSLIIGFFTFNSINVTPKNTVASNNTDVHSTEIEKPEEKIKIIVEEEKNQTPKVEKHEPIKLAAVQTKKANPKPSIEKAVQIPVSLKLNKTELCAGEALTINVLGASKDHYIRIGQRTISKSNATHYFRKPGTYSVSLINKENNSIKSESIIVRRGANAKFNHNKSKSSDIGTSIMTSVVENEMSHKWYLESKLIGTTSEVEHTFSHKGKYQIKHVVSDIYGCMDSSIETIRILRAYNLMATQIFNPNKDKWLPLGLKQDAKDFELTIIGTNGDKVFVSNSKNVEWDGTKADSGKKAKDGEEYFWIAKVQDQNGKTKEYGGSFIISHKL
ncbi:MAG: gliding motility-associated C-terminal domain-containing protein [Salibacteraceae bacterium]